MFFAPFYAGGVGVFDPTDDTFTMVDISGTITTGGKFQGAAYVPGTRRDGRVVFAPHNADGVGVFDPADDSFALFDISDAIDTNYKFVGAATADDGRVVFVPHNYYTFGVGVFTLPPERMTTPLFRRPCSATGRVRRIAWGSTWVAPRTRFRTP